MHPGFIHGPYKLGTMRKEQAVFIDRLHVIVQTEASNYCWPCAARAMRSATASACET